MLYPNSTLATTRQNSSEVTTEWARFLDRHEWHYMVTLTTEFPLRPDVLERYFKHSFIRQLTRTAQKSVRWFYVVEGVQSGRLPHIHALLWSAGALTSAGIERAWKKGFTTVRRFDHSRGGASYVVKEIARGAELYGLSDELPPVREISLQQHRSSL